MTQSSAISLVRRRAVVDAVVGFLVVDLAVVAVLDFDFFALVDVDFGRDLLVAAVVAFLVVVLLEFVVLETPNLLNLALLSSTTLFASSKAWFLCSLFRCINSFCSRSISAKRS